MNELPAIEHGDRRRAAAEIDHGAAEFGLVVGKHREAARERRGGDRLDGQMAAVDRELDVAEGRLVGADDMHVDTEFLAGHAARIGDAALPVDGVADGERMDDGAAGAGGMFPAAGGKHAADVAFGDRRRLEMNRGG